MKILVTGAAGFIGSKLIQTLASRGDEIVGIDNMNEYYDIKLKYGRLSNITGINVPEIENKRIYKSQIYSNYSFIKVDLEDKEFILNLFEKEKFDKVCHLAAQAGVRYSIENPEVYIYSNIVGFLHILEGCRHYKVKHLVYASSSSVYGMNSKTPFSEQDNIARPTSLYAATKASNELMAHAYSSLYKIPTTGLRFFTVYGPWGRPDMAPFLFTESILKDKPIKVFNNGDMLRDFTYIDDIVEGLVRVIDSTTSTNDKSSDYNIMAESSTAPYKIYNIGNSKPVKLIDFIHIIEKKIGKKADKILLPMQAGDVYQTYADISSLEKDFNFRPKTDIEEGVEKFVSWCKNYI